MISQRCPKCHSRRIRRGYQPTPILLRMFGIYNLLCDHCNLLFRGFAVPGTVSKPGSSGRKKHSFNAKQETKDPT
ncbi:MAG: hypothetical protein ACR2LC_15470 [Pyrinomonadaceae bacterium]